MSTGSEVSQANVRCELMSRISNNSVAESVVRAKYEQRMKTIELEVKARSLQVDKAFKKKSACIEKRKGSTKVWKGDTDNHKWKGSRLC